MRPLTIILYEALLISTLHYSPTQTASLSPNPDAVEVEENNTQILTNSSKRGIRQVVPTAFKPICKRGERLNIRNECVPSLKLPVYSPKTKRPSAEFVSFTTLPAPSSYSTITTTIPSTTMPTATTPLDTTTPMSTTTVTMKEQAFSSGSTKSPGSTDLVTGSTDLVTIVMMQGLKQFLSPKTEKFVETHSTSTPPTTAIVTFPPNPSEKTSTVESTQFTRKHKCFFHTDSAEKVVSSAYEDYDY